jgi:amino acid permease
MRLSSDQPERSASDHHLNLCVDLVRMDAPDLQDYSGIMERSLGVMGEYLSIASIVVSAWGSCIAYLLFIKDNCHKLFGLPEYLWVLIAAVPLLLLSMLDDVRFLAPISVFGLGCAFTFACLVVAEFFVHVDSQDVQDFFADQPVVRWETLPLAMSIAAFCNEGIVILTPSTRNSMKRPSIFLHVSAWSIVFFTVTTLGKSSAVNNSILCAKDTMPLLSCATGYCSALYCTVLAGMLHGCGSGWEHPLR